MRTATPTRNLFNEALAALLSAGFTYYEGSEHAEKAVGESVWCRAYIDAADERIRLRWETRNQVEVADRISINIDDNAAAFVAALAAVEVTA